MLSPDARMNTVNTYHFVWRWIHALAYGTTVYGRLPPLEAVEVQLSLSTGQADENGNHSSKAVSYYWIHVNLTYI